MAANVETRQPRTDEPWTIGGLLDWTARFLAQKGAEYPRLDSEVLLAHALGCRRIELYTRYEELADSTSREKFRGLVRRRLEGCPVAYLVGRKEFFALEFEVNPAVLIPRPESEFVVMECLRLAKGVKNPRVLDIGTGSGNIAVAIAHARRDARVTALDKSNDALAVARRNAGKHRVAETIRFLESDLFAAVPAGERFDFIVSNPPYIAREEIGSLPIGVRQYEPHLALDGGSGGYEIVDRMLPEADRYLEPGGYLIIEIGAPQAEPMRRRLGSYRAFQLEEILQDYSGHPRVLRIRKGFTAQLTSPPAADNP